MDGIEITGFRSDTGPLTKRISLAPDGSLNSDGSACVMSKGIAKRLQFKGFTDFAQHIGQLTSAEAIALGSLRADLADEVKVVTDKRLTALDGHASAGTISRTADYIGYEPARSAAVLLDFDTKAMPAAVEARLAAVGGFWPALVSIASDLEHAERVVRASTSAGIVRTDTGTAVKGSAGVHVFLHVQDGADAERFLKTLHDCCFLAGYGWMMVGAGGQLLERSIIDRMVYAPERLVFEGPPILAAPLEQDASLRVPVVHGSMVIDTVSACRTLTLVEESEVERLKATERVRLRRDADKVQAAFLKGQAARIAARTGSLPAQAQRTVEQICKGILLPNVELAFDAEEFAGSTVADVLRDPCRFVGETLADPLEGIAYGRCKAKVMQRPDQSLWINSFAHGRAVYELKFDGAMIEAAIKNADPAEALYTLIKMSLHAELTVDELHRLKLLAMERAEIKPREMAALLKQAGTEHARERADADRDQAAAARTDRRVQIPAPAPDDQRLPVLAAIDDVFGSVREPEPPMRDLAGRPVEVRDRAPLMFHELAANGANQDEAGKSRLPAPAVPLLTPHDTFSYAHQVERHIEFVQNRGERGTRSVALSQAFVEHHMNYRDSTMPRVGAVVVAPLVLSDGTLLAPDGLDRERRMVLRIQPEMRKALPQPYAPKPTAKQVCEALAFLTDEWLVDVATSFEGKCALIAMGLTILERVLLPARPAFFVTAGKRGGGKTTALTMVILAVTGKAPPAAAWSSSEDERRKALLAYLSEGLSAMVFDNIPLATPISCPTIEKILTAESYSDRVLSQTAISTVPAFTVIAFTGNNIAPKGDLASRSLIARLDVDDPDPENRPFKHSDPISWTLDHRGKILRAMYVLMLGNPQLKDKKPERTRFKRWWHLVGSAIEHASAELAKQQAHAGMTAPALPATPIDFVKMFADAEVGDEENETNIEVLAALDKEFNKPGRFSAMFQAKEVADYTNTCGHGPATLKAFFSHGMKTPPASITSKLVGHRIKAIKDTPIVVEDQPYKDRGDERVRRRTLKLVCSNEAGRPQRRTADFQIKCVSEETYAYPARANESEPRAGIAHVDAANVPREGADKYDPDAEGMFT